jgi:hypothetical protein
MAANEKVNTVVVESNFGDGMFTQLLRPVLAKVHPCDVDEVRNNKQKELRVIDTLEPVMNQHRLVIDKAIVLADIEAEPAHQLFHQMTRITRDKGALAHDDLIDALAGAVAYFGSRLDIDTSTAEERHKADALDRELERFFDGMGMGGTVGRPNWTDHM